MTNSQIQRASVKKIAEQLAHLFKYDNIRELGREFDNYWENGRGDKIAGAFRLLYYADPTLRTACATYPNKDFFSPAMINESVKEEKQ